MLWQIWMSGMTMMLLLCSITTATAQGPADSKPGCRNKCGNAYVPYPFGIGDPSCALNDRLFLNCSRSSAGGGPDQLWLSDILVRNISLDGTMTISSQAAYDCYNRSTVNNQSAVVLTAAVNQSIDLGSGPFTFSDTRNKFITIGCDTIALMPVSEKTYGAAGISLCNGNFTLEMISCSGFGCSQTSIPKGLKSLSINSSSISNHVNVLNFNPCGYAFLADKNSFTVSDWPLSRLPGNGIFSDVAIEWVAKSATCESAKNRNSYACGNYTDCIYSSNGKGHRCSCREGFTGNPYLPSGCLDIDECENPETYPCKGKCKNTMGNYTCSCPFGMRGDGKLGCQGFGVAAIVSVVCAVVGVLLLLIGGWWIHKHLKKTRAIQLKRKFFERNGGLLLQKRLSSSDQGGIQKTRVFSSEELETATDNFNVNRILGQGGQGTVYKGMLVDGEIVAVKSSRRVDDGNLEGFINEVVILSQINHRNVVRLLSCCLETEVPLLVYEFIPNGTLFQYIHGQNEEFPLSWEVRLKITTEIAGALSYLHSAANIPIYHRDIKSTNILLDEKYRAKIADFGTSRSITVDQTHLTTDVIGTFGYLDPEYFQSGQFTDKSDVYSFGVVLVELLTGKKPILSSQLQETKSLAAHFILLMEQNRLTDILDAQVKRHSTDEEAIAMANLAKRCLHLTGRKRPTMKEVTMELESIGFSRKRMNVQQVSEEAENIMTEVSSIWDDASTSSNCSSFSR